MVVYTWYMLLTPLLSILPLLVPTPQAIDAPGPETVGWRDLTVVDQFSSQGNIKVRVYYPASASGQDTPADPSGGPFPLVNMMHGWLGSASGLDDLSSHIASWGFVVVSTDTNRGFLPDTASYARDSRALLHWAESSSQDSGSWLLGMVQVGADWSAVGHSMGGGTLSQLIGIEPRVTTVIGMQAADNSAGEAAMRQFTGQAYYIAGGEDNVVIPREVHDWVEIAYNTQRNVYWKVLGMGHGGPLDDPPDNEPMPGAEQARMHRLLVTGLLRLEMQDATDLRDDLFGGGMAAEPVEYECRNYTPVIWAEQDPITSLTTVGIAGRLHGRIALAWSLTPAAVQTPFGLLGIDQASAVILHQGVVGTTGVYEVSMPANPVWLGTTVYFTGAAAGRGAATRIGNVASVDVP